MSATGLLNATTDLERGDRSDDRHHESKRAKPLRRPHLRPSALLGGSLGHEREDVKPADEDQSSDSWRELSDLQVCAGGLPKCGRDRRDGDEEPSNDVERFLERGPWPFRGAGCLRS